MAEREWFETVILMEVIVMEKRPFHEVILADMEKKVEALNGGDTSAEAELRALGSVFQKAVLPRDKRSDIVKALREMAKKLTGAAYGAGNWLESIAEDVGE